MHAMIVVVGLLLAGAPAKPAKAPRDIADFYEVLARDGKLEDVLKREGGTWAFKSEFDERPVHGAGTPIVDSKNGYLRYQFEMVNNVSEVTLALFTTTGAKKIIGVGIRLMDERDTDTDTGLTLYEFTGASYRDVTAENPLPTARDFLDGKSVPSKETESLVGVSFELPREGTTLKVHLHLRETDSDPDNPAEVARGKAIADLEAHVKVRDLALAWDKVRGKFSVVKPH